MGNLCIVPGTFDPITIGHIDIIERAARIFERVIVTLFVNSAKKAMFTPEERGAMLAEACRALPGVETDVTNVLLADYARAKGARAVMKGIRGVADYDYEYQLAMINRELGPSVETIWLPSREEHSFISSTFVREMIMYGRDISKYVPHEALPLINKYIEENKLKSFS